MENFIKEELTKALTAKGFQIVEAPLKADAERSIAVEISDWDLQQGETHVLYSYVHPIAFATEKALVKDRPFTLRVNREGSNTVVRIFAVNS